MFFKLDYINLESCKELLNLLILVEKSILLEGNSIEIDWYVKENNSIVQDTGQDLAELIKIPVNFKKY
ncbi:MAG: DUF1987 domain-containing protein [Chloroflexia bacterium]|nr:DUF1987 domain-containing protein [Chloroflexia bacterium]